MAKEAAHQRRLWKQLGVTPDSTWQLVLTFSASRIGTSDVLLLPFSSKDHNDILCFDRCEGETTFSPPENVFGLFHFRVPVNWCSPAMRLATALKPP